MLRIGIALCALLFGGHAGHVLASNMDTNPGYTQTRYPIVLVHGMAMYDDLMGISGWYRIPRALRKGGAQVFVLQVSALNSTEVRGEQAARQIETILATTGAEKVNLIGHSHGSPTSRYVAGVYPDYVASVTSVDGVNWGTPVADKLEQDLQNKRLRGSIMRMTLRLWGGLVDLISGNKLPQHFGEEIHALSTAKALEFNQQFPAGMPSEYCGQGQAQDEQGIRYFSWTGNKVLTNFFDISDVLLLTSASMIHEPNDGLVAVCATYLGTVIRDDYRMNHLDAIDQLFGLHSSRDTDPVTVYRQHANRLQGLGL